MVRIYGPLTTAMRGAIVTMNVYDPDGRLLDYRRVEELAGEQGISLRTGCFCNPGAGEVAHGLTKEEMTTCFTNDHRMSFTQFLACLHDTDGKSAGAIRISVGLASNFADVYRFVEFARSFLDKPADTI